jgi:hypothetical protein
MYSLPIKLNQLTLQSINFPEHLQQKEEQKE